jgi:hypothetical protein
MSAPGETRDEVTRDLREYLAGTSPPLPIERTNAAFRAKCEVVESIKGHLSCCHIII